MLASDPSTISKLKANDTLVFLHPISMIDDTTTQRQDEQPTTKEGDAQPGMNDECRHCETEVGYAYDKSRKSHACSAGDLEPDLNFGLGSCGRMRFPTAPSLHMLHPMSGPTPTATHS